MRKRIGLIAMLLIPMLMFSNLAFAAFPSDLVRTKDWGNETLTDSDLEGQLDLIINWLMASMDASSGHDHSGTNKGKPVIAAGIGTDAVTTDKIIADAVTFVKIDDDGDFGLFTGDWSFNELALVEDSAPATAASEMKLYTKDTGGQPELFVREESSGDEVQMTSGGVLATGAIVQVVNTQTGAVATGTTAMPSDDTIPQSAEGDEYMTLAITPTNAANELRIDVTFVFSHSANVIVGIALFQDATAGALAAVQEIITAGSDRKTVTFSHYMTAGTTSSTTFKVRAGGTTGATLTFNGASGARLLGGVMASSMTITEIVP